MGLRQDGAAAEEASGLRRQLDGALAECFDRSQSSFAELAPTREEVAGDSIAHLVDCALHITRRIKFKIIGKSTAIRLLSIRIIQIFTTQFD